MWWFWILYGSMIIAMIVWGIWLRNRWQEMPELADIVYDERIKSGELPKKVQREDFTSAFIETEGPRRETYRWVAAITSVFALPLLVRSFNGIWNFFWHILGRPPVYEQGYMLHTFCTFLFAMGVIILILFFTMRRYFRAAPRSLKAQVRDLVGETT